VSVDQERSAEPVAPQRPPRRRFRPRLTRRGRRVLRGIGVLLVVFLAIVAWSLGSALTAPGNDPISARLAEWGRDHGLGVVVTAAEDLQYHLHPPKVGGRPNTSVLAGLAHSSSAGSGARAATAALHAPLTPFASPSIPGEGAFKAVAWVHGQPAIQVAYLRPDSTHTSYLTGVAWMSGKLLSLVQHPGFEDPGQLNLWNQPDTVPPSNRSGLLATFNSGFKIKDSGGGYYANGHTLGTLTNGAASLVVYRDGHADVGAWGTGQFRMGPDVVSVRQNLKLLINGGRLAPNLDSNVQSNWGATINGAYFVWRSGIGVTASGDLVYVAGDALSVTSLANLLHRAGAVRAMQLDINVAWISYMWYSPSSGGSSPVPHKLVPFQRPVNRYYTPTSRDFFAVYAR
jgi:Phosphodiester glycosidase